MFKDWLTRVLAILAAVVAVAGVATLWGFYPVGVIALLTVGLAAALWVALDQHVEGEGRRLWESRRTLLDEAADPVVEAYDQFIDAARRKLLLAD